MDRIDHVIEQTTKLGHTFEVISHIKSGKEAEVYRALLDGELVAMKVYKKPEERDFKNTGEYLTGKFYKTPSHKKAIEKNNEFSKKLRHSNWVKREFQMLQELFEVGASIPKPLLQIDDAIFMELLGDDEVVAPRLSDVRLTAEEAKDAFDHIIASIEVFWNYGVVHADLSAFNILWWESKPYIIDFPQAVDVQTHPNARELLQRDLDNVIKYFKKYISIDEAKVQRAFQS
jgi:RIO kinase 1